MNMASTAANSGFKPNLTLAGAKHKSTQEFGSTKTVKLKQKIKF